MIITIVDQKNEDYRGIYIDDLCVSQCVEINLFSLLAILQQHKVDMNQVMINALEVYWSSREPFPDSLKDLKGGIEFNRILDQMNLREIMI